MEQRGIRSRTAKGGWRGGYSGASRDYADPVPCAAAACPVNRSGHCGSPALCRLNAEAQCITFLDFKRRPATPQSRRCAQCGGCVVSVGGKWMHDGENLSHEPIVL